ncbi:MAG: hypothetical protein AAB014_05290 [Nitrospirota bacterium]
MIVDDIVSVLIKSGLPVPLCKDLIETFTTIKSDLTTGTLERAAPGKFVETAVQVLQYLDSGKYDSKPAIDDYLKNIESRATKLPDDLKITAARIARSMYTLRNKRSILHKGAIDPNIYDLRYLYSCSQWILSETVRHALKTDVKTAADLVAFIQIPISDVIEDFGDRRLVLADLIAGDELLLVLRHYYPNWVPVAQIHKDMSRRARPTVSNALKTQRKAKLIEGDTKRGYKLTALGFKQSTEITKRVMDTIS